MIVNTRRLQITGVSSSPVSAHVFAAINANEAVIRIYWISRYGRHCSGQGCTCDGWPILFAG